MKALIIRSFSDLLIIASSWMPAAPALSIALPRQRRLVDFWASVVVNENDFEHFATRYRTE